MIYDVNGNSIYSAENNGALNVLDYGFSPDGVTDNLEAFNRLIEAHPAETLYFPKGIYAFSGKLILDQCYIELDNAELKCTADTKVDRFLEIRGKCIRRKHRSRICLFAAMVKSMLILKRMMRLHWHDKSILLLTESQYKISSVTEYVGNLRKQHWAITYRMKRWYTTA